MLNFTEKDLELAIGDGLVRHTRDDATGYTLFTYTDKATWTPGAFDNPAVRAARGLIVNGEGEVVARPWPKFFNYGQEGADQIDPDRAVEVSDKADGSLGILFLEPDGTPRIATKGSFTSEQAVTATRWIQDMSSKLDIWEARNFTFLFEIIYPDNRIVLDYDDFEGLILLGAVHISTGTVKGPGYAKDVLGWTGRVTKVFPYHTLKEALEAPPRENAEGLVVRQGNKMLKIKQEDYLRLHKIVFGLNKRAIWQAMMDDQFDRLMDTLPDEFHHWALMTKLDFGFAVDSIEDEVHWDYEDILEDLDQPFSRAQFAGHAKQRSTTQYLFAMLDGKDVDKMILKSLRPNLGVTNDEDDSSDRPRLR